MVMPYRIDGRDPEPPVVQPRQWWRRPLCWLLMRHDWIVTRDIGASLAHLHPLAGCDAYCVRCGKLWMDYDHVLAVRKLLFSGKHPDPRW